MAGKGRLLQCGVAKAQHNLHKPTCSGEKFLAPRCCVLAELRQLLPFPGEVKSTAHETSTKQQGGAVRTGELTRLTGSSQFNKEIA
jgi:hypothetical protein